MNHKQMDDIIVKFIGNTTTDEELTQLNSWLQDKDNSVYFDEFIKINYLINLKLPFDKEASLDELKNRIKAEKSKKRKRAISYFTVASVALLIALTVFFKKDNLPVLTPTVVKNTVKIGTDKAVLTLEDGTDIALEKGQNYKDGNLESNGENITYNEQNKPNTEISYNYLTIPRGGQFHVVLADGSQVWLNSETKLKYPTAFVNGLDRKVELIYGEAYFDVSPSTAHQGSKFKVVTKTQEVQVLGTQFNIKAYKEEKFIYTTLVEGKVAMAHGTNLDVLSPNQQSILNTSNSDFIITKVDTYSEIAWKKGLFSFRNKNLKDIMVVLSRWYDVDFVFADKKLENIQFKGVLSRNQNIEEILTLIKNTNYINDYVIDNNIITLKN